MPFDFLSSPASALRPPVAFYRLPVLIGCFLGILGGLSNGFTADEAIEMGAESPGVKLIGKASVGKLQAKKGASGKQDLADLPVVNLGAWSKLVEGESAAEFVPEFSKEGLYDVYVRWSAQTLRGMSAEPMRLTVLYQGGEKTFRFPEDSNLQWVFLGTYPFKPGAGGMLRADGTGSRGASAILGVRFVPVADPKKALAPREANLPITPGAQDEFDKMRVHAAKLFTASADGDLKNPEIAQAIAQQGATNYLLWKSMIREEGQVNLWADLPTHQGKPIEKNEGGGWPLSKTFDRVAALAAAYVKSNAELGFADKMQGNPELLKDILFALEWLYENRFNERSQNKFGAEWIGMEVGNPMQIAKTLLLLYPLIPKELMEKEVATMQAQSPGPDKFYGSFPATGFNLLNGIYAFTLRSILTKNKADMDRIAGLIESEYQIASRSNPIIRGQAPGGGGDDGEDGEQSKPAKGGKAGKSDKANKGGDEPKTAKEGKSKSSADGYYADGSFIQHGSLPYIGIYGRGMLERFGQIQAVLAGSPWEIKDPRAEIFYDMVYRGYAPLFFGGEIMYGSLGRSTGQSWHQNGTVSSEILNALVPMLDGAPPDHAAKLKAVFRGWILAKKSAAYPEFSQFEMRKITPANYVVIQQLMLDDSVNPASPTPGTKVFHNTDYVVHHQPNFAAQLRMFSTRIRTHEDINEGTNRLGWYQGFGTLFVYDRDNSRYNDHFWATVNPYRLAGTTVDTRPREVPGSKNGDISTSPWAGGVELEGFGLASMDLIDPGSSLTARKAWFFLDDQVVCLGSGIRSTDDRTIETIVENAKLHGQPEDYPFMVDGKALPGTLGWTAQFPAARWAHLGGKVPGTDLGWVFPTGADLTALRETRKGSWQTSFVKDAVVGDVERNFLTLWYDHGKNPDGKDYAYIILPGKSAAQTKEIAEKPSVEIIQNSTKAQAVRNVSLGVTAVNFWEPGDVAGLASSGKAAVLVVEKDGRLSVAVADPTQLETSVEISLKASVRGVDKVDPSIEVVSQSPLKLKINLEKSEGRTMVASFKK